MRNLLPKYAWLALLVAVDAGGQAGAASLSDPATLPPTRPGTQPATESVGLPSIGALHVRRHERSETTLMEATVELAPAGLRVRQVAGRGGLEMLQNFRSERAWLIDRKRRISHELAFVTSPTVTADTAGANASFLGTVPCGLETSHHDGGGRWRGRAVDVYSCLDAGGETAAIELLDRLAGIVVYRRTSDGMVDELRDIRDRTWETAYFTPPSRFRQVDKRELLHGSPALSVFNDSSSD